MKHLPRAMNRFFLFIFALFALGIGSGLVLVATWKKAADFWQHHSSNVLDYYTQLTEQTRTLFNDQISWLTIAFAALAVIIALVMLVWIFRQGGGSTKKVDFEQSNSAEGTTVASLKFVDALVNDALGDDRWVIQAKASGWKVKRQNGLSIKVITVKGADPYYLKQRMNEVIARLDSMLGHEVPICVYFTTGWKSTFTKPERVH